MQKTESQNTGREVFSIASDLFTDKHAWEEVVKIKLAFLRGQCEPLENTIIRPEIAASWERSCQMGIDMEAKTLSRDISDEEFESTYKHFRPLIEEARPLLHEIKQLDLSNEFIFELITAGGTSVLQIGDYERRFYISERSEFNESTMGTNAHSLCMLHKTPLVVVGPEHYSNALRTLCSIAAPILDKEGNAIASLLLIQDMPDDPWSEGYRKLISRTMGLITSIASTIESRAKFKAANRVLEDVGNRFNSIKFTSQRSQHILDATLSTSPNIIFIVSSDGIVEQASLEASHLMKTPSNDLIGKHVDELFKEGFFTKLLADSAKNQSSSVTANSERYIAEAKPIPDAQAGQQSGYVLRLTEHQKHAQAASRGRTGKVEQTLSFDDILGQSPAITTTVALAKRYAPTLENILINGESGTGKEYFAQSIHHETRPNGPFISLNCAAIPAHLIESELFGYEAGSFTGADKKGSPGKIELAQDGTLFLDEIGDMPLDLQATLLRVLENKQVMRVGGKSYKQVDFRIIAATNRDLMDMVNEGTFREDLLYRLSILTLVIPPLRSRTGDMVFFAKHYLDECRKKNPDGPSKISKSALDTIEGYHWPGNVRQLKNAIYSAFYSTTTDTIERQDLPAYITEGSFTAATPPTDTDVLLGSVSAENPESLSLHKLEESAIKLALLHANNNVTKAADLLQISKATLYRKIKDYEIVLR